MQAFYPKGSYNFQNSPQGGFSFYAPGPSSVDLTTAKEATFGYTAYFAKGFNFVKGGKVPGLCKYDLCYVTDIMLTRYQTAAIVTMKLFPAPVVVAMTAVGLHV